MKRRWFLAPAFFAVAILLSACSGRVSQRPVTQGESSASPFATAPADGPGAMTKAAVQATGTAYQPDLDPADFVEGVTNPYFPLAPGTRWAYRTLTSEGTERNDVVVTDKTRTILGIRAVVVHDTVKVDGKLTEDTYDWYAQERDGTVWYLGEDTKELENGKVVSTKGSWEAGVDGAQPGVIMQAAPSSNGWYWQEYYSAQAEDQARVLSFDGSADVPFGRYSGLLVTEERSPIEPAIVERKYYRRGMGVVLERVTKGPMEVSALVEYVKTL